ncbi:MAG: BrnT family toxin [Campylobacterales bacterium]|nr:BrnT family toxin [Campylobacterales bacterium]
MTFEYDETKSKSNQSKHGIDFEASKALWADPYAFELPSKQCEDEEPFLVLGQIKGKNYTAIMTHRDDNIRIISVRRSREKEIELYERVRAR